MRSDSLLPTWELLRRLLDPACPSGEVVHFSAILDANAILELLRWHGTKQRDPAARSDMQELLDGGHLSVYGPAHLWDEVAGKIPELATELGLPEDNLRQHWEKYAGRIGCLELRGPFLPIRNGARDPDDHPYIHLQRQHPDLLILTRDKDLPAMKGIVAPPNVLSSLRDHARCRSVEVSLLLDGVASLGFGRLAVKATGGAVMALWRAIPLALKVAIGAILILSPEARRVCADAAKTALDKVWGASVFVLQEAGQLYEIHGEAKLGAAHHLARFRAALPPIPGRRTLRVVVRDVLARSDRPLTLTEIAQRVPRFGYRARGSEKNQHRYLRRILDAHPDADKNGASTWSLRPVEEKASG